MKAIFIHDHNFVHNKETNLYYDGSGGAFDENLWNRYLSIFDSLVVVGRQIEKLPNKLVVSSAPKVSFQLIKGASGFKEILKNKSKIQQQLKCIIEEADFAIIRLPSTLGRWAFDICIQLGRKYVLEIVGDPFEAYWYHGSWQGKLAAPVELFRLKRIVKTAQHVIYVTQNMLQKRYPCSNSTCGISNVRLEEVANKRLVNEFYNNKRDIFKIGLIGSFHVKYKGHIEALKALRLLKNKGYSAIELHFVGTGDSAWINCLVQKYHLQNDVKIIGAVGAGKDGILPFLDQMDLYIHPSKTEGLPRVILEAMSRGKICLGSNVGGTAELLEMKYIHEPGDWESLALQIENLLGTDIPEKIYIAMNNLQVAEKYIEPVLQEKRFRFINKAISHEADNFTN